MCYKGQLPKVRNALPGVQNEIEDIGGIGAIFGDDSEYWDVMCFEDGST